MKPEDDRPAGARRARSISYELESARSREYQRCYDEACLALSLGISVIPPSEDGRKRPLSESPPASCEHPECVALRTDGRTGWKHRQHRRAGETALRRWYLEEHRQGVAYVCGKVSGGLLLIEFEARAVEDGTFNAFLDLAEKLGLGDLIDAIREGYEDRSPSGGVHWFVFCDDAVTEALASISIMNKKTGKTEWRPLIETRGEGACAIAAPTSRAVHPSGKPWERISGDLEKAVELRVHA